MIDDTLASLTAQQIAAGDFARARQTLEDLLGAGAQDRRALSLLLQLADRSRDYAHGADWLCRSLERDAQQPAAYALLGYMMAKLGQFEAALECFDKAIALEPANSAYHCQRGAALAELGRHALAVQAYQQALQHDPRSSDAHTYLGTSLLRLGQADTAIAHLSQAIALDARCVAAYVNRGNAYLQQQAFALALADYDQAVALQADHVLAHTNRAAALKHLHRWDESLQASDRAIALDPHSVDARFNKSLTELLCGDLSAGFRGYQVRWQTATFAPIRRNFSQPLWLGEQPLQGKRLLVHNEQGLGDSIQFCRYLRLAAHAGAQVIYEVQAPLYDLFQSLEGVSILVRQREPLPAFDLYCPVMSLPLAFGTSLQSIPAQTPYLQATPAKVAHWGARLGPRQGPRIGLVWSGNPTHQADRQRSIDLAELLAALPLQGEYISLQQALRPGDAQTLAQAPTVRHFGPELADFSDTAAVCMHLDLVIAVDTSVAHLAGALGVPTCLLLPHLPDWRWLLERPDSPWYPCMRLLRQHRAGDWSGVLRELAHQLPRGSG